MFSAAGQALLLIVAVQASTIPAQPPRAVPFDCSWIYDPPQGPRQRFEGVYTSFIDDGGFYSCSSAKSCREWIGGEKEEIAFSEEASEQLRKRKIDHYGVFRIVFEARRGKLRDRPGCANPWRLEWRADDYLRIEKVLRVKPLDQGGRGLKVSGRQ